MPTAVTPTIEELVACKPQAGDVPFYDGTCRGYDSINQTAQEVLDCMIGEDLGLTGISIIVSPTNDIDVDPAILELTTFNLIGTILSIGQNWTYDLLELLNTSYYVTDGHNNYEIKNHENLRWVGIDGIHFNIGGGNIEIGLPTPVAQYFTPGRCTPGPLLAYYSGHFAGITTAITIVADTAGSAGNITLTFTAGMSVNDAIAARNLANPTNIITLASGDGTQEPGDGEFIALHGGADANTCQETDYIPNNKWLVLTRDCNTNSSQWMPPQCCLQQMSFSGGMITIDVNLPGEPLPSINTDNQQLSLVLDAPTSELLCLTRRHGGTLGIQIPDPDSCVDLININEHLFDLQGNLLYLLGSDLLINSVVDLNQVNEHTLELTSDPIDPLHPHDPLFPRHDILDIIGSDGLSNGTVDLNGVAQEMLTLMDNLLCVQKIINSTVQCNSCRNDCVDLSILEYDCEDVANCVGNTSTDRSIYLPNICTIITDPATQTVWNNFFCNGPVTINQTWIFISQWIQNIQNILIQISEIVHRQKYRARISLSTNRRMWSQHTGPTYSDDNNARWFVPGFDVAEGRHSSTNDMVDPTYAIAANPYELIIPALSLAIHLGTGYNPITGKSDNNINSVDANSQFAQYDCRTIKIVKTGWYNVELQGVVEADHNVNAFRYSCLRFNAVTNALDLLIDSKFGGGSSVGSGSLNNELVPCTHQYHAGGSKILKLNAGDILFPAIKIDPRTIRPKQSNTEQTKDILYELDVLTYLGNPIPYGIHTGGAISFNPGSPGEGGSAPSLSRSPGSITYPNHTLTVTIPTDTLAWPTSNLPNVSPHFFSPHGGLDGASAYSWNLTYPGGNSDAAFGEYRRDDGCVTLYGPASRWNSDGSGGIEGESEGASLSVHRVNAVQH